MDLKLSTTARNIARLRSERGYTYAALAGRCGVSAMGIRNIEVGKNSPTLATLEKIATALGVTSIAIQSDIFIGGDE